MEDMIYQAEASGPTYSPTLWKGNSPQTPKGIQLPTATHPFGGQATPGWYVGICDF